MQKAAIISPVVHFHFLNVRFPFTKRRKLKAFFAALFEEEKIDCESIAFIFCEDAYLVVINRDHLGHDYYTDVITFDLASAGKPVQGEIFISIDTVRNNAIRFKTTQLDELMRVMIHGCLHLCGYGDKTSSQKAVMRKMEDFYHHRL